MEINPDRITNTSTADQAIAALAKERARMGSQAAERAAARIRQLSNPTHEDYSRIIAEEYARPINYGPCSVCRRDQIGDTHEHASD